MTPHLRSFEVVAILCHQRFWWVIYRAKGQRSGVLSEVSRRRGGGERQASHKDVGAAVG
jgi:hypothetical protein